MKRWPITFALLLPMVELCVCFLMLTVPAMLIYFNLQRLAHGSDAALIHFGEFSQTIPRSDFVSFATKNSSYESSHFLTALSIPGLFGEALIDSFTTWPDSWHPKEVSLESWRSTVVPIYCLPFWILVGCGVDSFLGWRRLHWTVLLMGTLLCVVCAVLFVGLCFTITASERGETSFPLYGLSLWSVLFATLPALWIRQWRARQTARRENTKAAAARNG